MLATVLHASLVAQTVFEQGRDVHLNCGDVVAIHMRFLISFDVRKTRCAPEQ